MATGMTIVKSSRAAYSAVCASCRRRLIPAFNQHRAFTTTPRSNADSPADLGGLGNIGLGTSSQGTSSVHRRPGESSVSSRINDALDGNASMLTDEFHRSINQFSQSNDHTLAHRLHVYAHKHNTHLTFVQPPRRATDTASSKISGTSASATDQSKMIDVLISMSTGNIGFRKAARGSFDAAYQLTAFVFKQIQEKGILNEIQSLEVVLRGFGAGREAVSKALMGAEGRRIRGKVSAVVDATRLKQGGPRSKKPRRLG